MVQDNRTVALTFLRKIGEFDTAALAELLTPGAHYWVAGMPRSQLLTRAELLGALDQIKGKVFQGPIEFTFHGVTAEGNRVAVEATSTARLLSGKAYANTYHFLLELDGGKVSLGREYADTKVLDSVGLGAPSQ
jgi:ketosteroid isomerase-like protein